MGGKILRWDASRHHHPRRSRNTPQSIHTSETMTIHRLCSLFPRCKLNLILQLLRTNDTTTGIIHHLESSGTPIDKLNCPFRLDASNSGVHILRYHVPAEQQTTSHVLAVTWIAFYHLIGWLKACTRDLSNAELLVVSFLGGDDRGVCG